LSASALKEIDMKKKGQKGGKKGEKKGK